MEARDEVIPVTLNDGTVIQVEATVRGEERVATGTPASFDDLMVAIESLSKAISTTLDKVKPQRASVEFGVEVALESGKLTALLVKGSATASMKVILEWDNERFSP